MLALLACVGGHRATTRCGKHHICGNGTEAQVANRCTSLSSNGRGSTTSALDLSLPAHARFVTVARAYAAIFQLSADRHEREVRLRALFNRTLANPATAAFHGVLRYVNSKMHSIHALTSQMRVPDLWQEGSTLLDLGCGSANIAAFLSAVHGTAVRGYEVQSTSECDSFLASPLRVNFMTAEHTPRVPEPPLGADAVSIMNTLHHVAERTPAVLEQAAALARKYILITEDFCSNPKSHHCWWLHKVHDTRAIYRRPEEWRELFRLHCPEFQVVRWGHVLHKMIEQVNGRLHLEKSDELTLGVSRVTQPGVVYFVLQRNATIVPNEAVGSTPQSHESQESSGRPSSRNSSSTSLRAVGDYFVQPLSRG